MNANHHSKGIYPVKAFPQILGAEAAGVIVKLPTDESVLNDEAFKRRGYRVGMKVLVVRPVTPPLLHLGSSWL